MGKTSASRSPNVLLAVAALFGIFGAACAPAGPSGGQPGAGSADQPRQTRTLAAAIRIEPAFVAGKPLRQAGLTLGSTVRLFNAALTISDDRGLPRPYLAESLIEANTDSWRIFPDGRMETTYRLKPNLTWHDGVPLSSEDFAFAWRIYTEPDFGLSGSPPQSLVEEVVTPDARTLMFRWKRPYPFAGVLEGTGSRNNLPPLPRHLLEEQFAQQSIEGFAALPYWTTEFVGLGPFKLDRWEPGAFIEVSAFDGHALGRPKIDRMRLNFMNDANAALAGILSGAIHLLADDAIYFQQAVVLKREWATNQEGRVVITPGLWRFVQVQLHPERVNPRQLTDVRVRKALAFGVDKQSINDGIYEGEGINSDSVIPPTADYHPIVDRAVVKYPYDPRRSEQLMAEAGFTKAGDGFFTSPTDGQFSFELKVIQNAQNESEQAIMASVWRRVGFDVREAVLPAAQAQDGQVRAMFQALFTTGGNLGEGALQNLGTAGTPRVENRWNGTNRSSWSNAEFDRLVDAYNTTLDRNMQIQQIARMAAIFSDELPAIAINFNPGITAHVAALTGPQVVAPDTQPTWNVHEWELR
jgi:peptide/nickel transport system substrate-binding protein